MITYLLILIFFVILLLPLLVKKVEHNIELFLLAIGVVTVTLSHALGPEPLWGLPLLESSLVEPVKITVATLVFGLVFRALRDRVKAGIVSVERALGPRVFAFLLILALGLLSSVITAIIAALLLCEIVSALGLDRKYEVRLVILSCFSIGMGAALTPIGEPLSTITLAKLRGGELSTDFLFLIRMLGVYILPGLLIVASLGAFLRGREAGISEGLVEDTEETVWDILRRAALVYLFVMALVLLGAGFKPLIDSHISRMSAPLLYWVNISSAVLDNATLAAAELGPQMTVGQITGILMGIIISGGMLIPGNIPNIISASKLRISSREWAVFGAPFGLLLMAAYFVILFLR
jgi:predicted cation transporter